MKDKTSTCCWYVCIFFWKGGLWLCCGL